VAKSSRSPSRPITAKDVDALRAEIILLRERIDRDGAIQLTRIAQLQAQMDHIAKAWGDSRASAVDGPQARRRTRE
jgi:hypothetical protein